MATRLVNIQKEMKLIHAWVDNPNIDPLSMIDWPLIGTSPVNEYITLGLIDMAFSMLFPNGQCDWLEPRL